MTCGVPWPGSIAAHATSDNPWIRRPVVVLSQTQTRAVGGRYSSLNKTVAGSAELQLGIWFVTAELVLGAPGARTPATIFIKPI